MRLNLVSVSFKCRGINTEGREVFCDFGYLMMNDDDTGKLMLRAKLRAMNLAYVVSVVCVCVTDNIAHAMRPEQPADRERVCVSVCVGACMCAWVCVCVCV